MDIGLNKENEAFHVSIDERSKYLRTIVLNGLEGGGRGHLGPAISLLELLRVLYDEILIHDPKNPQLEIRDRFILSKGHGCLGLYAVLADAGYFPVSEINGFCKFGSRLGGHPEWHSLPGIEFSTGSLGHGLPVAVGVAIANRIKKLDSRTFVLMGDGEINEGSIWEAALHASKHQLGKLIAIIDYNKMQAGGSVVNVLPLEPLKAKWESFGFQVSEINGHDLGEIREALGKETSISGSPNLVIAHTIKGKGLGHAENNNKWHHKAKISLEEIASLREYLIIK
jgi:transketolase